MRRVEPGTIAAGGVFAIGGDMPVHSMGFGAMRLCGPHVWGEPADPAASLAMLRHAVALGIDFIDTAEVYGPHVNERQIADALHPYPERLVIATKCGVSRSWPQGAPRPQGKGAGSPAAIRTSIEGSLKRLKLERIDLYQLHRVDPDVPLEETVGALGDLRREGKVRHIGLSEVGVDELTRACKTAPIATVQNRYNVVERFHDDVLAFCEARGIGFIPWYPLGNGGLSQDKSALARIAARHGASPAQAALAWLLARSPVMLLIPGTASIAHLEENTAAAGIKLDASDMIALDALAKHGPLAPA